MCHILYPFQIIKTVVAAFYCPVISIPDAYPMFLKIVEKTPLCGVIIALISIFGMGCIFYMPPGGFLGFFS
jgi:hypothetical protein